MKKNDTYYLEQKVIDKVINESEKQDRSKSYIANKALKKGLGLKDKKGE